MTERTKAEQMAADLIGEALNVPSDSITFAVEKHGYGPNKPMLSITIGKLEDLNKLPPRRNPTEHASPLQKILSRLPGRKVAPDPAVQESPFDTQVYLATALASLLVPEEEREFGNLGNVMTLKTTVEAIATVDLEDLQDAMNAARKEHAASMQRVLDPEKDDTPPRRR